MPHMAKLDNALEKLLSQAAEELGIGVDMKKISLSTLLAGKGGLSDAQRNQILALFQGYGANFTPALMLGDEVCFAGKQPTLEKLKEKLQEEISHLA